MSVPLNAVRWLPMGDTEVLIADCRLLVTEHLPMTDS